MKVARINPEFCVGCEACIYTCPVGAVELVDTKAVVQKGCIGCGACVDECNWKAITLVDEDEKKKNG